MLLTIRYIKRFTLDDIVCLSLSFACECDGLLCIPLFIHALSPLLRRPSPTVSSCSYRRSAAFQHTLTLHMYIWFTWPQKSIVINHLMVLWVLLLLSLVFFMEILEFSLSLRSITDFFGTIMRLFFSTLFLKRKKNFGSNAMIVVKRIV